MARKTFISYKHSEAQHTRDKILKALGSDATYYQGETADSPDLTDLKTESIKENLKDMIFNSSVTIVILSPNMTSSKWMEWEIKYSLKEIKKGGLTSKRNGILAVIQKGEYGMGYSWLKNGWSAFSVSYYQHKLLSIIKENRNNRKFSAPNHFSSDYVDIIEEEEFLKNPSKYIERAFEKSQNHNHYNLKIEPNQTTRSDFYI